MEENSKFLAFPEKFKFGTSVAAFQVEGNTSKERKTDWDVLISQNANQIIRPGEVGPDWWAKDEVLEKDLKEISEIGVSLQRLSIEWDRIEPEEGQINFDAIKRYRLILDTCKKYNLTPYVTINHFTLPNWVAQKGGWENKKIIELLSKFTELLLHEFGDVKHWIIINEPSNVVYTGHLLGIFPPNKKSLFATIRSRNNIVAAQNKIYKIIKDAQPDSQVGNAFSFLWLRAGNPNSWAEKTLSRSLNYFINNNFIAATKDSMDFLGMNYYTGYYVNLKLTSVAPTMRNEAVYVPHNLPFARTVRPKTYKTDMGWPIVPDFFVDVLKHTYQVFKKPILITENGIADRDDVYRSFYILTHLAAVWKAIDLGTEIQGYIHWATVDNLEWLEGFAKRFGLISVDPFSGERKMQKGTQTLKTIIAENGVAVEKIIDNYVPELQRNYARYVIGELMKSSLEFCPRITSNA